MSNDSSKVLADGDEAKAKEGPLQPITPPKSKRPRSKPHHIGSSKITWSPWLAIVLVVGSYVIATVVAQLVIAVYPLLHHWTAERLQNWINDSVYVQFFYALLAYVLLLLPIIWFLRLKKVPLKTIGLKRIRWRDPALALAVFPFYIGLLIMVISIVHAYVPEINVDQQQQVGFNSVSGVGQLVLVALSLIVIPAVAEEITMRGFLFTSLRARWKLVWAVLVTSILFALGHLQFGSGAPLLWVAAIDTFLLSLFLILLRVKTDSLWASICLHALKNGVAFLYIFVFHKG